MALKFTRKNRKEISELLDLKFNNDYDVLEEISNKTNKTSHEMGT